MKVGQSDRDIPWKPVEKFGFETIKVRYKRKDGFQVIFDMIWFDLIWFDLKLM